jgi:hypothetical protein
MGMRGIYNVLRFNEVFIKSSKMVSSLWPDQQIQPACFPFVLKCVEWISQNARLFCMYVCVRVHMYVYSKPKIDRKVGNFEMW